MKSLARLAAAIVLASAAVPSAHAGLVITPTFDSSIDTFADAAVIKATINAAIAQYAANFSDNININIKFQNSATGLGASNTWIQKLSYASYRTALVSDSTTADDTTALASLPIQTNSPADNQSQLWVSFANLKAIGINPGSSPDGFDGTISLNLGIMNHNRTSINALKYDLQAITQHEIDEVLGFGSGLNLPTTFPRLSRPQDLFRYSAAGTRSYTTSSTATSYFSINGGVTNLAGFNQTGSGDYGDFDGGALRVQNAFGTPGATPNMGVELIGLDVIGYNRVNIVPEPGTFVAAGLGAVAGLVFVRRRRSA